MKIRESLASLRVKVESLFRGTIVRNASFLYGTTIVTSFLGFLYWFIAARMVPASAVGTASAIQAAAQVLSFFCVLGLSTLLISELSHDRTHARSLILTSTAVVGVFSLITSAIVGIVLGSLSPALRPGLTGTLHIVIFAVLGMFTSVLIVLDDSCIGLLRGDLQFRRNTVFAATKLALLPLLILFWPSASGTELVVAWLIGLAISMWTLGVGLVRITSGQPARLEFRELVAKRRLMLGHHSLNLSVQLPRVLILVLVAIIVGPAANAAFTAAILVVGFVNVIPVHLTTALFALAPGDEEALHREVSRTMRICLAVSLVSAPFFIVFSHFILGLFGKDYQSATAAMIILGLTTYPVAIRSHFVSIARVRGRIQQAAYLTMIGAFFEVGLAAVGAELHGLTGTAAGYCAALILEALMFGPTVFGVLRKKRTPRHGIRRDQVADGVIPTAGSSSSDDGGEVPPGAISSDGGSRQEELAERGEWDD